jgi:Amt family ammonium transporter
MEQIAELSYALDTFYFLMSGALVMWMACGFAMLEAGMVRGKNTAEILTKNIALYALACIMFMLVGYNLMYPAETINQYIPGLSFLLGAENSTEAFQTGGDDAPYYSARSDFFFQVVFVAAGMSIVSGAVAERMKLWSFLLFAAVFTSVIYPIQGFWKWKVFN